MSLETNAPASASAETTSAADLPSLFLAELQAEREPAKSAPEAKATPEPAEAAPESEAAPVEAETESEAEVAEDAATAEPEEAAETPSDTPAIAAPSGMSDADKAEFAKLPSEMKAWVTRRMSEQTADYTRKSQAIAEEKKLISNGATQLVQKLQILDAHLAKFTDHNLAPPNPALRVSDPMAYDEQLADYMHAEHQKKIAGERRQEVEAERQRVEQQQWGEYIREQEAVLRERAPEFYSEKGPALRKQILEYGTKQGYTTDQLTKASAADILTLWKAQRFDAIEAAKKNVKTVPPPAPTTAKPGPAKAPGRPSAMTHALKTLDEKPTRANLAAAYLAELKSERR